MSGLLWLPARALLFLTAWAASFLPREAELRLGCCLGRMILRSGLFRKGIVEENMRRCLPELSQSKRRDLLGLNFEHYGVLFFEYLHLLSPIEGHYREYARRWTRVDGLEHWRRAKEKGKGVIVLTSHVGVWELAAAGVGVLGVPLTFVTRRAKPPWFNRILENARLSVGGSAAYHPGSMPAILRALRRKETVGFMMDQYAPPPMGMRVRFFGVRVDTLAAIAPLALRTGAAIVPAVSRRRHDGTVHIHFEPELDLGPLLPDTEKATEAMAAVVEGWVRENPVQWLWLHRRFKNVSWPGDTVPGSA